MPLRTQPNIYFVAFDVEILQMIGKSVRWMWTAQNRAFPRLVSRFAMFPAAPARPAAAPAQCRTAFPLGRSPGPPSLGGSSAPGGHGGGGMQGRRKPGVSPPNTENTKKTHSLSKIPQKQKGDFQFYKSPLRLLHKYFFNSLLTYRYVYGIFKAHRRCYQCKSIKQLGK